MLPKIVLEHEASRPGRKGRSTVLLINMGGHDHDTDGPNEPAGQFEPVHARHRQVRQDEVG
jgi:hypothetical protein